MDVRVTFTNILAMYNYEAKRYTFIGNFFKNIKGRLLDVGCCKGDLKKYLDSGLKYYGVDRLHEKLENLVLVDLNSKRLPYRDKVFDAVNCSAVLEYLFYPLDLLGNKKSIKR